MSARVLIDCQTCDGRGAVRSTKTETTDGARRTERAGICRACRGTGGHLSLRVREQVAR